jgi:hypothetical protein
VGFETVPFADRRLQPEKVALYEGILRAVYDLHSAGITAVDGSLLAARTGLDEGAVGEAAVELRENNFFDTRSGAPALRLTPEQVAFGVEGACRALRQVCALSAHG